MHNGKYWVDHCNPFGLCTAHGLLGMVTDFLRRIMLLSWVYAVLKWVDDIVLFRIAIATLPSSDGTPRYQYRYDLEFIISLFVILGVPWHPIKRSIFADVFTYLGFVWWISRREARLVEHKRRKFVTKLEDAIRYGEQHKKVLPLEMARSVAGTLNHASFVYQGAKSRLPIISAFPGLFEGKNPHVARAGLRPGDAYWRDMRIWKDLLAGEPRAGFGIRMLTALKTMDMGIWVDASTDYGVAIVMEGTFWAKWKWKKGWNDGPGRHIGWGEAIAVEMAARAAALRGVEDVRILVRGDNMGVQGAYHKGYAKSKYMNECIRWVAEYSMERNVFFHIEYVASEDNISDAPSRGYPPSGMTRLAEWPVLPDELVPYLEPDYHVPAQS